jgi:hypothetical protein
MTDIFTHGVQVEKFITKDSGARQEFETGARRDTQDDKPRFDLIPTASLERLAGLYGRGAEKYGPYNWARGIPVSRNIASLERHLQQYKRGDRDEDHLAAVAWNAFAIMHYEAYPHLYEHLMDLPDFTAGTIRDALAHQIAEQERIDAEREAQANAG